MICMCVLVNSRFTENPSTWFCMTPVILRWGCYRNKKSFVACVVRINPGLLCLFKSVGSIFPRRLLLLQEMVDWSGLVRFNWGWLSWEGWLYVGGVCVQSVLLASWTLLVKRDWSFVPGPSRQYLYRLDEGVRFVSSITLQACAFMRSH
jgi:hypothetical protein